MKGTKKKFIKIANLNVIYHTDLKYANEFDSIVESVKNRTNYDLSIFQKVLRCYTPTCYSSEE